MCKFICTLFSSTSKAISTTSNAIDTGLKATNLVMSEVNKGLNDFSNCLDRWSELEKIAADVYKNNISYYEALNKVKRGLGVEEILNFETKLDRYRNWDYKSLSYQVFPIEDNQVPISQATALDILTKKYGKVDKSAFDMYIKERKDWIINFLSSMSIKASDKHDLSQLTDRELHRLFSAKLKEIGFSSNIDI